MVFAKSLDPFETYAVNNSFLSFLWLSSNKMLDNRIQGVFSQKQLKLVVILVERSKDAMLDVIA